MPCLPCALLRAFFGLDLRLWTRLAPLILACVFAFTFGKSHSNSPASRYSWRTSSRRSAFVFGSWLRCFVGLSCALDAWLVHVISRLLCSIPFSFCLMVVASLGSTFFVSLAFDFLFYFIAGYCGIATVLFVLHSSAYRGNHLGTTIFNFYFIVCYKKKKLSEDVNVLNRTKAQTDGLQQKDE